MRIIKEGRIPEEIEYEHTCNNCKTVFAYKKDETSYHSDYRQEDWYSLMCPFCHKTCNVYPSNKTEIKNDTETGKRKYFIDPR